MSLSPPQVQFLPNDLCLHSFLDSAPTPIQFLLWYKIWIRRKDQRLWIGGEGDRKNRTKTLCLLNHSYQILQLLGKQKECFVLPFLLPVLFFFFRYSSSELVIKTFLHKAGLFRKPFPHQNHCIRLWRGWQATEVAQRALEGWEELRSRLRACSDAWWG